MLTPQERRRRRFSAEFRAEQAALIEQGKLTIPEVCRLYEVSYDSVKRWVKRFGKQSYPETIIVGKQSEYDKIGNLESKVSSLEQMIGRLHVELHYKDGLLAVASKQLGSDFEKKTKLKP